MQIKKRPREGHGDALEPCGWGARTLRMGRQNPKAQGLGAQTQRAFRAGGFPHTGGRLTRQFGPLPQEGP